jgi:diketogulonate reductase-like aldo/keto reductase
MLLQLIKARACACAFAMSAACAVRTGVANFGAARLRALCDAPSTTIRPAVNQIEVHPGWRHQHLLEECADMGVHVTAYAPLGSGSGEWHSPNRLLRATAWCDRA